MTDTVTVRISMAPRSLPDIPSVPDDNWIYMGVWRECVCLVDHVQLWIPGWVRLENVDLNSVEILSMARHSMSLWWHICTISHLFEPPSRSKQTVDSLGPRSSPPIYFNKKCPVHVHRGIFISRAENPPSARMIYDVMSKIDSLRGDVESSQTSPKACRFFGRARSEIDRSI